MIISQIIAWGSRNPKNLFILDGFGALLSAFLLGVVLVQFESIFGIPRSTLYILAALPCLFVLYDVLGYRSKNTSQYLQGIARLNIGYSMVSLAFAFYHAEVITLLGWGYLVSEIFIILSLARIEFAVARRINP